LFAIERKTFDKGGAIEGGEVAGGKRGRKIIGDGPNREDQLKKGEAGFE